MKNLPKHLYDDYKRFEKQIPDSETYARPCIGYHDVLKAHYFVCDYFESTTGVPSLYGVKNFNLLGSAIGRQLAGYSDKMSVTFKQE